MHHKNQKIKNCKKIKLFKKATRDRIIWREPGEKFTRGMVNNSEEDWEDLAGFFPFECQVLILILRVRRVCGFCFNEVKLSNYNFKISTCFERYHSWFYEGMGHSRYEEGGLFVDKLFECKFLENIIRNNDA